MRFDAQDVLTWLFEQIRTLVFHEEVISITTKVFITIFVIVHSSLTVIGTCMSGRKHRNA